MALVAAATDIMVDGVNSDAYAIHDRFPHNPVALYIDSNFAWSKAQEDLFSRKIRISNVAGYPGAAAHARALDTERGAANWSDVLPFVQTRKRLGHEDATIYCAASNIGKVMEAAGADIWQHARLWMADWWGQPGHPSAEWANAKAREFGFPADLSVWALQYASYSQWDMSIVYGVKDWSR